MAFMDELVDVLNSSPSTPPRTTPPASSRTSQHIGDKRTSDDAELSSDDEGPGGSSPTSKALSVSPPSILNQNLAALARRLGTQKKLKLEQRQELEEFAGDTLTVHNLKLYAKLLSLENKVDKIVACAPPFQVSKSLTMNILTYSTAVFFSSKLPAYKGQIPRNHVLDMLKRLRFDLPPGIENNPADWGKVKTCVQDTLTQIRGATKKLLKKSIVSHTDTTKNLPIFDLAQAIVANTDDIKVTIPLMARVALMRGVFMEYPGEGFWDQVDAHLNALRERAGTPEQLVHAFKHILKADRKKHGSLLGNDAEEAVEDVIVDTMQQNVDDTIEEANHRLTTSRPLTAGNSIAPQVQSSTSTPAEEPLEHAVAVATAVTS
ncbi:hypothetical protein FKP32DRAFT_1685488 [Trametes sanguinea]|nr:hypothetical protein FKP32DRAFT_1685488 [Trametes sanguinea]